MHIKKDILSHALCLGKGVLCGIRLEKTADGRVSLVASCRPRKGQECRCPECGEKAPVYDHARQPRRWRTMDLGAMPAYIECTPVRVRCPEHKVVTADVPWAEPGSRFTREFEDQVAWLAVHCSMKAVSELMRIDWHTVGGICRRAERRLEGQEGARSRFDGLVRIGIDETSYKKGHKYLTVIVDHDRECVIWCAKGYGKKVLEEFLGLLSKEQRESIQVVTADGAKWIAEAIAERCPNAERVMDPFHVVSWMEDVLDSLRRKEWNEARRAERRLGKAGDEKGAEAAGKRAKSIKGTKYALLKGEERLSDAQKEALAEIRRSDRRLYKVWQCKERLRRVIQAEDAEAAAILLRSWLNSASHIRIPEVQELSKKVRRHKEAIIRAVELGISNARVESINNKIKLTVRMAYGFRNVDNLIALVMLRCSWLHIQLPGRS